MRTLLFSSISLSKDIALLMMRATLGLMILFGHGLEKLMNFTATVESLPDVMELPPVVLVLVAVFAEVFCAAAVVLGFATRLALIPLIVTMIGAVSIVHIDDPYTKVEPALMYLTMYIVLFLLGPGHFSLDAIISHQQRLKERPKPDPW